MKHIYQTLLLACRHLTQAFNTVPGVRYLPMVLLAANHLTTNHLAAHTSSSNGDVSGSNDGADAWVVKLIPSVTPGEGNILYINQHVDQTAAGYEPTGNSWENAIPELADALQWAREQYDTDHTVFDAEPLKIHVAAGTYKPRYKVAEEDTDGNPTTDRDKAFVLVPHVQLYGGFAGNETALADRDWEANPTILSGDFNDDDVVHVKDNNGPIIEFIDNGENTYHVVVSVGDVGSARVDGFTIKGGNAFYVGVSVGVSVDGERIVRNYGGGIYCASSSPAFANIHLTENAGGISGGGMRNQDSSPTLTNVLIEKNSANEGGGIANVLGSSLTLNHVTFTQNNSGFGGGVFNSSSTLQATGTTIRNNRASNEGGAMHNREESLVTLTDVTLVDNNASDYGGAIYNVDNSTLTLTNGIIQGNKAGYSGGGLYNEKSPFTLININIHNNRALGQHGGGIFNDNEGVRSLPVLLRNVTLTANTVHFDGGGFYNKHSNPVITNITVVGNKKATSGGVGIGIFNIDASPQINNAVFYENRNPNGVLNHFATVNSSSNPVIKNSLVQAGGGWDNYWGANGGGNIVSPDNPFADFEGGDYTLSAGSPAIDAGSNTLYTDAGGDLGNDTDLTGNPRVHDLANDGIIDMGAYEHQGDIVVITPGDPGNFITTWKVEAGGLDIVIPTNTDDYVYNYNIYWQKIDDTQNGTLTGQTGDVTLTFPTAGEYRVEINGDFPAIYFYDGDSKDKILTIAQWGTIQWQSMERAFYGTSNLTLTATDAPDLSQVTNMSLMFRGATAFNSDVSVWDVGNVTSMIAMFYGATAFNGDVSTWDVGNVTSMNTMFYGATAFNGDVSGWDVGNVTSMYAMFEEATAFDRDLGAWNIENVRYMNYMFDNSGLSTAHYDATLSGWANQANVPENITLGAIGLAYCASATARDFLITNKQWHITGDSECVTLQPDTDNILYVNQNVDQDAAGYNGSGNSWENAIPELADALLWAREQWGDDGTDAGWDSDNPLKIFVATGEYKPLYNAADGQYTEDGGRDNAFVLVPNVQLYGGFNPTNGITELTHKRLLPSFGEAAEGTVLSGDLQGDDGADFANYGDNAYHVLIAVGDVGTARLDGFTISGGNANGAFSNRITVFQEPQIISAVGGGVINASNIHIFHTHITTNRGTISGGWGNLGNDPTLRYVILSNNQANTSGGWYNNDGNARLTNVLMKDNGLGWYHANGSPVLTNVTVLGNWTMGTSDAPIAPKLYNSIVLGNDSQQALSTDYTLRNTIVNDALYDENGTAQTFSGAIVDEDTGHLVSGSPAIDAGDNQFYTDAGGDLENDRDLAGSPRLYGDVIDLGAYEMQWIAVPDAATLAKIGQHPDYPLNGNYIQTADIDLSGYASDSGWLPIGNAFNYFIGTFDGNGYSIRKLVIDRPSTNFVGLFGVVGENGLLTRIRLLDVAVKGADATAALVGNLRDGTVTHAYVTGMVEAEKANSGGLVGVNGGGFIRHSLSAANVRGYIRVGGLAGANQGVISDSYATGKVEADNNEVGGAVGYNLLGGKIERTYAAGLVVGNVAVGGLIGRNGSTEITDAYWNVDASGQESSAGGEGKSDAEMRKQATFEHWDFNAVWAIDENESQPYLRWLGNQEEPPIEPGDGNILYVDIGKKDAEGHTPTGDSWANAIPELADALLWAREQWGDDGAGAGWDSDNPLNIYVATGEYKPLYSPEDGAGFGTDQKRDNTFLLVPDVQLYGGFDPSRGIRTLTDDRIIPTLSEKYPVGGTVLSGDLDGNDGTGIPVSELETHANRQDNAHHVVLAAYELGTARLDGFMVTGGNANGSDGIYVNNQKIWRMGGGGMYNYRTAPAIANTTFQYNSSAETGGGLYNMYASAILDVVSIQYNYSESGGGIWFYNESTPMLRHASIHDNHAQYGAGAYIASSANPTFREVDIRNNKANADDGGGGGVYISQASPIFINTTISKNSAWFAAGIYSEISHARYINVAITDNVASWYAGGISNNQASPTFVNTTITNNSGAEFTAGIYNNGPAARPIFQNSVVWGNGASSMNIYNNNGGALSDDADSNIIEGPNAQGNIADIDDISLTGLFANPGSGDYRMKPGSPAVNAGSNQRYEEAGGDLATDIDLSGNPRVRGGTIDLGAYESGVEDVASVKAGAPITVAYGTPLDDVAVPGDYTVTAVLTDGMEVAPDIDTDTDNWTLVASPPAAGGSYDGNTVGNYEFSVPLVLAEADDEPYFTNSRKLVATVIITVAKGIPAWTVKLDGEEMTESQPLERTYGDMQSLEIAIVQWDGNMEDISWDITKGVELVDIAQFPQISAIGVGEVIVQVTLPETDNFAEASATFALHIGPRPLAVEAVVAEKTYGDDDPVLAVRIAEGSTPLAYEDALADVVGTVSRNGGADAGSYAIQIGRDGSKSGLYDISFDEENTAFTIHKAEAAITVEGIQEHVYDGTMKNVVASLNHSGTVLAYTPQQGYTEAGRYPVVVSAPETGNYLAAAPVDVELVIAAAEQAGITFEDGEAIYDGTAHSIYVSGAPKGATVTYTNNGRTDVGIYTITATVKQANHSNLELTANLTIHKAQPSVTASAEQTHMYDGTAKAVQATVEPAELAGQLQYSPQRSFTSVGMHRVRVYVNESANYLSAETYVDFSITPAEQQGLRLPNLTVTYDGQPHALEVENLPADAEVSYTINGDPGNVAIDAGIYEIRAVVSRANHADQTVEATLTIHRAAAFILGDENQVHVFDGRAKGLDVELSHGEGGLSFEPGNRFTESGTYTVEVRADRTRNYRAVSKTFTLRIDRGIITGIGFEDGSFVYDGTAKHLSIDESQLPEGTRVNYGNNTRTDVGSQTVTATIGGGNYETLELAAELVITPAERSIEFPALADKTYGDGDFPINATASTGEDILYTSSNPAVAEVGADGTITIMGAGETMLTATLAENDNYVNMPLVSRTLTVGKASQTIMLSAPSEVNRDARMVPVEATSSSGLPVSLSLDDPEVATLEGTTLHIHRLGAVRITATQEGDANHESAEPVTVSVRVIDPEAELPVRVSKAVSPNGDGINEYLVIEGIKEHPENRVSIFNRNGTVVYEASGYNNGSVAFRGIGTGQHRLPAGTYFYVAEVRVAGKWKYEKGWFVLRY